MRFAEFDRRLHRAPLSAGNTRACVPGLAGAWLTMVLLFFHHTAYAFEIVPLKVPVAAAPIVVDGRLDEPGWQDALRLTLDYEVFPGTNTEPPVDTKVYLAYDDRFFYIGVRAFDPEPQKIRARLTERDESLVGDYVGVFLDTFGDRRRAYRLFANPLGVQTDEFFDDIYDTTDRAFDVIWDSAGRITDQGYEVEMALPFRSLRFANTRGARIWGIDFFRYYPRGRDYQFAWQPIDRNRNCTVCQQGYIRGFAGTESGYGLEIVPTLTSSDTDRPPDADDPFEDSGTEVDPGLDVRWAVTPNWIAQGTLNPDFSHVELDVAQLDVNERFALDFEERRPFFLEGSDFFNTPFRAVYTRNVADPDYGLKLTGKQGPNAVGAFHTDDQLTNLLFPGSQSSDVGSFDFQSRATVGRYRRDIGGASALGVLVTDRRGGDYENTVIGADGYYQFTETDSVLAQFLSSSTRYPDFVSAEFDQPQGSFSDHALSLSYGRNTRNYELGLDYVDIGEDFRADLGFLTRVDYQQWGADGAYIWYGGADDWWDRYDLGLELSVTEDQDGVELERDVEVVSSVDGPWQSSVEASVSHGRTLFNDVYFDQTSGGVIADFQPLSDLLVVFEGEYGDQIDFFNAQQGTGLLLAPGMEWFVGQKLRLNFRYVYEHLDVPDGRLFTANLAELRANYHFNRRAYVRVITQYQNIDYDPTLFEDPFGTRERSLVNQLLFAYQIDPRTLVYAGYSDGYFGDAETFPQTDRTLFLKLSYALQL